jgi:hypothetical protein
LTAVDDSLTLNSADLPSEWVRAASEAHLYVQTVAKGIAQQNRATRSAAGTAIVAVRRARERA